MLSYATINGRFGEFLYHAKDGLFKLLDSLLPRLIPESWANDRKKRLGYCVNCLTTKQKEIAETDKWSGLKDFDLAALLRVAEKCDEFDKMLLKDMLKIRIVWAHQSSNEMPKKSIVEHLNTIIKFLDIVDVERDVISEAEAFLERVNKDYEAKVVEESQKPVKKAPKEIVLRSTDESVTKVAKGLSSSSAVKKPRSGAAPQKPSRIHKKKVKSLPKIGQKEERRELSPKVELSSDNIETARISAVQEAVKPAEKPEIRDTQKALEYFERGKKCFIEKQYKYAIKDFTEALKFDSKYAPAYCLRAMSYFSLDRYDNAIEDSAKAVELDPNDVDSYAVRGFSYFHKTRYVDVFEGVEAAVSQYNKAAEDLTKALELEPDFNVAGYWDNKFKFKAKAHRGTIYQRTHQYDKAIDDFRDVIAMEPKDSYAYYLLGKSYFHNEQFDEAIENINAALALNPNSEETVASYYSLGLSYYQSGRFDEAIQSLTKYIQIYPKHSEVYNVRGIVYTEKGQYDEALADYAKALKYAPEEAEIYSNRGLLYSNIEQYDKAIVEYTAAIKLKTGTTEYYYAQRAMCRTKIGQYDDAIKDFGRAIKLNPNKADHYYNRGIVYVENGQYQEAIKDFQEALWFDPNDADAADMLRQLQEIDYDAPVVINHIDKDGIPA